MSEPPWKCSTLTKAWGVKVLHSRPKICMAPPHFHFYQSSPAAFHLVAVSLSTPHLSPPPDRSSSSSSSYSTTIPSFVTSTLAGKFFKAALFSVKCCVATSNALLDRAFLGFQHGGQIIGGRPQRILADVWWVFTEFFFLRERIACVFVCVRGKT